MRLAIFLYALLGFLFSNTVLAAPVCRETQGPCSTPAGYLRERIPVEEHDKRLIQPNGTKPFDNSNQTTPVPATNATNSTISRTTNSTTPVNGTSSNFNSTNSTTPITTNSTMPINATNPTNRTNSTTPITTNSTVPINATNPTNRTNSTTPIITNSTVPINATSSSTNTTNTTIPVNGTTPTTNGTSPVPTGGMGRRAVSRRWTSIVGVDAHEDFKRRLRAIIAEEKRVAGVAERSEESTTEVERTGDVSVPVQQQEQSQAEIESAIIEIEVPEQEVVQQAVLRPPPVQLRRSRSRNQGGYIGSTWRD